MESLGFPDAEPTGVAQVCGNTFLVIDGLVKNVFCQSSGWFCGNARAKVNGDTLWLGGDVIVSISSRSLLYSFFGLKLD